MTKLKTDDIFDRETEDESKSGESSDNSDEYEVDEIKEDRWSFEKKVREYLVSWKGYSGMDTWEPADNLTNCEEKLRIYNERKKKKKQRSGGDDGDSFIESDEPARSSRPSSSATTQKQHIEPRKSTKRKQQGSSVSTKRKLPKKKEASKNSTDGSSSNSEESEKGKSRVKKAKLSKVTPRIEIVTRRNLLSDRNVKTKMNTNTTTRGQKKWQPNKKQEGKQIASSSVKKEAKSKASSSDIKPKARVIEEEKEVEKVNNMPKRQCSFLPSLSSSDTQSTGSSRASSLVNNKEVKEASPQKEVILPEKGEESKKDGETEEQDDGAKEKAKQENPTDEAWAQSEGFDDDLDEILRLELSDVEEEPQQLGVARKSPSPIAAAEAPLDEVQSVIEGQTDEREEAQMEWLQNIDAEEELVPQEEEQKKGEEESPNQSSVAESMAPDLPERWQRKELPKSQEPVLEQQPLGNELDLRLDEEAERTTSPLTAIEATLVQERPRPQDQQQKEAPGSDRGGEVSPSPQSTESITKEYEHIDQQQSETATAEERPTSPASTASLVEACELPLPPIGEQQKEENESEVVQQQKNKEDDGEEQEQGHIEEEIQMMPQENAGAETDIPPIMRLDHDICCSSSSVQHQRVDVHREEDGNDSSTSSQKKRGRGRPPGPRAAKLAAKAAMKIQSRDGWQERQQRGAAAVAATIIASSSSSSSTKMAVASTSKSSTTMNKAVNLNLAAILDLDNIDLDNWEEELNAKLLSKEQLAQIPMEEEDNPRSYQPMQPFTMEGRAKGLVVRTFKNGGMNGFERGWKVESILGLSEENTCIVKFVGFSTLQKLPSDLVRKQAFQELCKYLDWISCKRNADKRGDYWEQKLQQPSSWMTDQARASLKIWREEQQQEEMASDADE